MSKNAKTTKPRNTERARRARPAKDIRLAEVPEAQAPEAAPEPELAPTPKEMLAETLARYNEAREALRLAKLADRDADREAAKAARRAKGMTCLEAAHLLLQSFPHGLDSKAIVKRLRERGLWHSPCGVTPWSTLYAGMFREIREKGPSSRFLRGDRKGLFRANPEIPAPEAPQEHAPEEQTPDEPEAAVA